MADMNWSNIQASIIGSSSIEELLLCLDSTNAQFFTASTAASNLTDSEKLSLCLLTGSQSELQFAYPPSDPNLFLNNFANYLSILLNDVAIHWLNQINSDDKKRLYYSVFIYGPVMDCFYSILTNLKTQKHLKVLQACYEVLKQFLNAGRLQQLIIEQSLQKSSVQIEKLSSQLINIPEFIDNKIVLVSPSNCFEKQKYTLILLQNIIGALEKLRQKSPVSYDFIGKLIGKLCFLTDGNVVVQSLLEYVQRSHENGRQISEVLALISSQHLESVALPFFTCDYITFDELKRYIDVVFGSKIVLIGKLSTLFYNRFIFIKYFRAIRPKFLLFYPITTVPERRYLLTKTLLELLTLWGNRSTVDQQPYEHHLALCESIIICFFYMDNGERHEIQDEILSLLVTGVPVHLESNHMDFKYAGMVTAEILTQFLGVSADKPLKFDYTETEDTKRLKSLTEGYQEDVAPAPQPTATLLPETETKLTSSTTELDSDDDDDLIPLSGDHDTDLAKPKPPKYLWESVEVLKDHEKDHERLEVTLRALPALIRESWGEVDEMALELTRVLLHLTKDFYMEDFNACRKNSLIGCAVRAPSTVAAYLCFQFYEENYTVAHRLDILDVLVEAAKELSKIEAEDKNSTEEERATAIRKLKMKPWEVEVMERVQKKTRRFASATKIPTGKENRFNAVCGNFFYALMNQYDKELRTLNLTEEDTLLLGRLIYTLGVVLHCARNAPTAPMMSKTLLDFLRVFTDIFVVDEYVKRTILFATSIVAQVCPVAAMTAEIYPQLMDIRLWAEELLSEASISSETASLAVHALEIMDTVAGRGLFPTDLESLSQEMMEPSVAITGPNSIKVQTHGEAAPDIPISDTTSSWLDLVYPAVVRNPNIALSYIITNTITGNTITDDTRDLGIKLRPQNPSCIPIRTSVKPCVKLILKVSKKTLKVEVLGVIKKTAVFEKLADFQFQYAPPPPKPNYCGIPSVLIDHDYLRQDNVIRFNPPRYATKDTASPYNYCNSPYAADKGMNPASMTYRLPRTSCAIRWKPSNPHIPKAPKSKPNNEFKQRFIESLEDEVKRLFKLRPIWSTVSFRNNLKNTNIRETTLRGQVLPYYAYYCEIGPWKSMWIKFGYDPRIDPINRLYQLIDFRQPRNMDRTGSSTRKSTPDDEELVDGHIYKSGKIPYKRQAHFQVCDIQDVRCQAVLRTYETNSFSPTHGFYREGATAAVRTVMVEQVKAISDREEAHHMDV